MAADPTAPVIITSTGRTGTIFFANHLTVLWQPNMSLCKDYISSTDIPEKTPNRMMTIMGLHAAIVTAKKAMHARMQWKTAVYRQLWAICGVEMVALGIGDELTWRMELGYGQ